MQSVQILIILFLKIELYDFQKDIIEHFKNNRFSINMSSRQNGITRIMILYLMHEMLYNLKKKIIIFNYKSSEGIEMSKMFKEIYKTLPFFMKFGVKTWNVKDIIFENESRISFRTYSKYPVFETDYSISLLNGFSKVQPSILESFLNNILPTMTCIKDNRLIISSRPNGLNKFYEIFQGAESGLNLFKPIKSYWWQVPNRGEKWKKEEIKKIGSTLFAQEYDLLFCL